jgi:hypothetical protein
LRLFETQQLHVEGVIRIGTMQQHVTAKDLADALNRLRLTDPMWEEGGFRVAGRWLEIDPDASDELAARMLRCDLEEARVRNEAEARWLVAGGVGVVYSDRRGWQPAPPVRSKGSTSAVRSSAPDPDRRPDVGSG